MDGILLVNKEKNMTSRDVVNIVSKALNTKKVGHTGTLDPIATGVLAVAVNKGLKVVDLLMSDIKEYIATVKVGISTDTLDVTGNIIEEVANYRLDKDNVLRVLNSFLGKSIQEVPIYSAVKKDGKKLYEYARNNIEVELPKREIEAFEIELLDLGIDSFSFRVLVSKGTYIRSLIRDIGIKLGIPCCMSGLERTRQGNFYLKNSYSIDDIKNNNYKLLSIEEVLKKYFSVKVDSYIENKILNGRILENRYNEDLVVFLNSNDKVIAIYKVYDKDNTKIKPVKVFNE